MADICRTQSFLGDFCLADAGIVGAPQFSVTRRTLHTPTTLRRTCCSHLVERSSKSRLSPRRLAATPRSLARATCPGARQNGSRSGAALPTIRYL
jgi:hypothetical protein